MGILLMSPMRHIEAELWDGVQFEQEAGLKSRPQSQSRKWIEEVDEGHWTAQRATGWIYSHVQYTLRSTDPHEAKIKKPSTYQRQKLYIEAQSCRYTGLN
jgi:hypothetical protein